MTLKVGTLTVKPLEAKTIAAALKAKLLLGL